MAINRTALKTYAPQARLDFIQAMTNRAAQFGITKNAVSKGEQQGELYIVEGKSFPRAVGNQREKLVERINQTSFEQVMEAVAYTWFNRFLAIRYMELHGYFDHGYRVLSHRHGHADPEILVEAIHLDLPGLKRDQIIELKLNGTQDEALYRKILIAQCNALHRAMPFLFEKIEDETELLLPENMLQSDSITRKLVGAIEEIEWDNIEIIGWLYQFYISERNEQIIGDIVKSEDIPAATQLFTPKWIVKYMVQNSLGAKWLGTYPDSSIKGTMEYYIEPAEQMSEVREKLGAITPKSLDPETLTLIDPAVGSGHILVEAYDLFKAIYIERGYTAKEAAQLILTKNLYGLDIDDRAAQMAGFALLMKARADDRNLLRHPPRLNVHALQESNGVNINAIIEALSPEKPVELVPASDLMPQTLVQPTLAVRVGADADKETSTAIRRLLEAFRNAKTFGSLITPDTEMMASLPLIEASLDGPLPSDLLQRKARQDAIETLRIFYDQAKILGGAFDCLVANPPYMGQGFHNKELKVYLDRYYSEFKTDLFSAFLGRASLFLKENGFAGFLVQFTWMFIYNFRQTREVMLGRTNIQSLVQLQYDAFEYAKAHVNTMAFRNHRIEGFISKYIGLEKFKGAENQGPRTLEAIRNPHCDWMHTYDQDNFSKIPGSPLAYWVRDGFREIFKGSNVGALTVSDGQTKTGDNSKYLRQIWEVNSNAVGREKRWVKHPKGGDFRKWYGNVDSVIDWSPSARRHYRGDRVARILPEYLWWREGVCWTLITSAKQSFRLVSDDEIFNLAAPTLFPKEELNIYFLLAFLNTPIAQYITKILNPTVNMNVGDIQNLPLKMDVEKDRIIELSKRAVALEKEDWTRNETAWEFSVSPLLAKSSKSSDLRMSYEITRDGWKEICTELHAIEEECNNIFVAAYDLRGEISPCVPIHEVTLRCNPRYTYAAEKNEERLEARLRSDTMRELVSYALGCMMGRFSLAEAGVVYAGSGNEAFDASRYGVFPADVDGIILITEEMWFEDDAANRLEEFLSVTWPDSRVSENLAYLVDGLIKGHSDEPRADLRSYFAKKFYIDHLQTYKNRPIYWLFSSGKEKAFECLVYMHRYNEGTLARMRTEYVTPLMGKVQARIEALENEITRSSSSAEKSRKSKDITKFRKQLEELRAFDEELRHLADQRIPLDLDEGVKVNYGKFGNLLAAKDKVCGKRDDAD